DTPLNLINIVVSDVDSSNVTATLTLSNTAAGALTTATSGAVTSTYNAGTGVWTASGAIADVNALLAGVTFNPAANFNGNFTIAPPVDDGTSSISGSKTITGIAVNDAPTSSGSSSTINEDTSIVHGALPASTDVDGDVVTYALGSTSTAHGSVSV